MWTLEESICVVLQSTQETCLKVEKKCGKSIRVWLAASSFYFRSWFGMIQLTEHFFWGQVAEAPTTKAGSHYSWIFLVCRNVGK